MSGGSHNYLADRVRELLEHGAPAIAIAELQRMAARIRELAPGSSAAREYAAAAAALEQAVRRLEALHDVARAVEWHDSNDWGPEDVAAAIAEYDTRIPTPRTIVMRDFMRALDVAAANVATFDVDARRAELEHVDVQLHSESERHRLEPADTAALADYFRARLAHYLGRGRDHESAA